MLGNSRVAVQLAASQEVLRSVSEWVITILELSDWWFLKNDSAPWS
jgi:hypothetical protein